MQYKLISPIVKNSTLEQIFYNRGFNNIEDIEHYLNNSNHKIKIRVYGNDFKSKCYDFVLILLQERLIS